WNNHLLSATAARCWVSQLAISSAHLREWQASICDTHSKHTGLSQMHLLAKITRMVWTAISEWRQKRKLRRMLTRVGTIRHLEKGIGADRPTTERLLVALGARKSSAEEWTLGRH